MKSEWPEFAAMRRLAMRFRGMMRSKNAGELDTWLNDVHQSGLYAMQRLAHMLRGNIYAVRNAITEQWNNGQTEGQMNRLKNSQTSHVWPGRPRTSARAQAAIVGASATEFEAEPIEWFFWRKVRYSRAKTAPDAGMLPTDEFTSPR